MPAAVSNHDCNVYYVGDDDHIHWLSAAAGTAWTDTDITASAQATTLPADNTPLTSQKSPSVSGTGAVWYIGSDGHVHVLGQVGSAWADTDLTVLSGATTVPVNDTPLTSWNSSTLGEYAVYYLGADGHVHVLQRGMASGWGDRDLTQSTGASTLPANGSPLACWTYAVCYIGTDGDIYLLDNLTQTYLNLTTSSNAQTQPVNGSPLVCWDQSVSYIGADGHIHQIYKNGSTWTLSDLTMVAGAQDVLPINGSPLTGWNNSICYVGSDRQLYQLYYGATSWQYATLTAPSVTRALPADGSPLSGWNNTVSYLDTNDHIRLLSYDSTTASWGEQDLTASSNAAMRPVFNGLMTAWRDASLRLDHSGHIHLMSSTGDIWRERDLTLELGATVAANGSPLTSWTDSVCYIGADNHIHQLCNNGATWTSNDLTSLSGTTQPPVNGSPLTSWDNSLCYIGADGHIQQLYFDGSTWTSYDITQLSGTPWAPVNGSPLASWTNSVCYIGTNGDIIQLYFDGSWQRSNLSLAAVAPVQPVNDSPLAGWGNSVYYVGTDGHIHLLFYSNNGWQHSDLTDSSGTSMRPAIGGPLTAWPESVCYIGTDGHVHQLYYNGVAWTDQDLSTTSGAILPATGTALASWTNAVSYIGIDDHVCLLSYSRVTWEFVDVTTASRLGRTAPVTGSPLTTWNDAICYRGVDGCVYQLYASGPAWQRSDLSTASGDTILPTTISPLAGWNNSVCYRGTDGHVHQLYNLGGGWQYLDLTDAANTTVIPASSSNFTSWHNSICYVGSDGHVHWLMYIGSYTNQWGDKDLTKASSATVRPAAGTPLVSWVNLEGDTLQFSVCYLSNDGHVHQLYSLDTGVNWIHLNLTNASGVASTPAGSSPLVGWNNSICYVGTDGHIHWLMYIGSKANQWGDVDLTQQAHAPATPAMGTPLASWVNTDNGPAQYSVCYVGTDGHVHQLYSLDAGSSWLYADLTARSGTTSRPAGRSPLASWNNAVGYIGRDGRIHQLSYANGTWYATVLDTTAISHVFVLMLENRSFDHMFAFSGIPGIAAATQANQNSYNSVTYNVASNAPARMPTDPGHEFMDVVEQLCGAGAAYSPTQYPPVNNTGFVANYATTTDEGTGLPSPTAIGDIMMCLNTPTQLPVLYQLATEFAICDHWFSSMPGPTWPNRYFVHGASSSGLNHGPTDRELFSDTIYGFRYVHGSIFQALTSARRKWRLYHDFDNSYAPQPVDSFDGSQSQVASLHGISRMSLYPMTSFASDLQGAYPYAYTFIEPNYGNVANNTFVGGSSQHPEDGVAGGEGLIKAVYEAIRASPLWPNSLLIITYDEHGGFYDSVLPGPAPSPRDYPAGNYPAGYNDPTFNFTQYGVRVPAVIVSPRIAKGTVDKTIYDHASIPATIERLFGLGHLTQRDASANDLIHLASLSTPRNDCPTTLTNPPPEQARIPPTSEQIAEIERRPLPKSGNLLGFLGVALKTELELSSGTESEKNAIIARAKGLKTIGDAKAYFRHVHDLVEKRSGVLTATEN